MYLPSLEAIYHDDIQYLVATPADAAYDTFEEADAMFMMEEEAAEIALRSRSRYAKSRSGRAEQRQ